MAEPDAPPSGAPAEPLELSARDWAVVVALLLNPPPPSERLLRTLAAARARIRSD